MWLAGSWPRPAVHSPCEVLRGLATGQPCSSVLNMQSPLPAGLPRTTYTHAMHLGSCMHSAAQACGSVPGGMWLAL